MGWGSIAGLVGSFLGQSKESEAQAEAAKMQAEAQQAATASERRMFEEAMGYGERYRQAGYAGLEAYGEVPMGLTEEDIQRMQEGTQSMRAMQAAQGRRKSGGSAEQLGEYATGYLTDVYNRAWQDLLERANIGAQFATGAAGEASRTGQDIASAYIGGAQAQTPYILAKGQQQAGGIAALSRLGGDIYNLYSSRTPTEEATNDVYAGYM